ncbi:hypothetical protein B9G53_08810 [Pseudanabaena sp. SR411]|uniref:hypothetical protein n=1 Tax=Pseudanabaena sp. SR411 TaxID=1980935 RepID=UPI000B99A00C|nr:hypothetical protein [Pseudanabaena sp. SR411]OYQ65081.1 hypothetical protein B9G53_08810 [Pseudanabaena sp. SR411]
MVKQLRLLQVIVSIGLLIGGCNSTSSAANGGCNDVNLNSLPSPVISTKAESQDPNIITNLQPNKPQSYTFSVSPQTGRNLQYSIVMDSKLKQLPNICVFVRSPSKDILKDSQLAALPENGIYIIEIHTLSPVVSNPTLFFTLGAKESPIPYRLEIEALNRFEETQKALKLLSTKIQESAMERRNNPSANQENKPEQDSYYEKLSKDEKFIFENLGKVLDISDISRLIVDAKYVGDNRRKLIAVIYSYQARTPFLYRKGGNYSDTVINGILNPETAEAITIDVLDSNYNRDISLRPLSEILIKNQANSKEIAESLVKRYFQNIRDRLCQDNWNMLTEETQQRYKNQEIEYLKKCIRGIKKMPNVEANEIIVDQTITISVEVEWNQTDKKQNIKFCLPSSSKLKPDSKLTIISHNSSCKS